MRGLNTAATIWCAAALGIMAGAHHCGLAFLAALLVTATNILLRPITHYLNWLLSENTEADTSYVTTIICPGIDEARIRAMLVQAFSDGDLHLHELDSSEIEGSDRVQIRGASYSDKKRAAALEKIVGQFSIEPGVTAARWHSVQSFV